MTWAVLIGAIVLGSLLGWNSERIGYTMGKLWGRFIDYIAGPKGCWIADATPEEENDLSVLDLRDGLVNTEAYICQGPCCQRFRPWNTDVDTVQLERIIARDYAD